MRKNMEVLGLLDKIKTKEKTHNGIIDFITKKYLIFYDLSNNESTALRIVVIAWRSETNDMRFSVYSKINFPDFELPEPIIIPIVAITNKENFILEPTEIKRKTKVFSL